MTYLQVFYGSMVLNFVAGFALVGTLLTGSEYLLTMGLVTAAFGFGIGGISAYNLSLEGSAHGE